MKINKKSLCIVGGMVLVTVGLCGIYGIYVGTIGLCVLLLGVLVNS